MFSTKFQFIWPSGFREEDFFFKSTNQKQELPMVAIYVYGSRQHEQSLYRGPSIHASYQVSFHLVKQFQRRRFLVMDQPETRYCLWWPCLFMDQDESSILYIKKKVKSVQLQES